MVSPHSSTDDGFDDRCIVVSKPPGSATNIRCCPRVSAPGAASLQSSNLGENNTLYSNLATARDPRTAPRHESCPKYGYLLSSNRPEPNPSEGTRTHAVRGRQLVSGRPSYVPDRPCPTGRAPGATLVAGSLQTPSSLFKHLAPSSNTARELNREGRGAGGRLARCESRASPGCASALYPGHTFHVAS